MQLAERRTLGVEVTDALRQAILSGRFHAGDHVTEAQIAEQMGVSHGPVREALRELESEDLIVIEPHRGAFVKSFTAEDVREVYELRTLLETAMVRLAVARLTPAHLDDLEALVADMHRASDAGRVHEMIELDIEFHRRLCVQAGNRRMYEAWLRLASPIRLFLSLAVPSYLSLHAAAESHAPILEALRRGDAEAAAQHMRQGVQRVGQQVAAALARASHSNPPT